MARCLLRVGQAGRFQLERAFCTGAAESVRAVANSVDETGTVSSDKLSRYRKRVADPAYQAEALELRSRLLATKRRVKGSPMLRLEEVAVSREAQRAIEASIAEGNLSKAALRAASRRGETARAPEGREKRLARKKAGGVPFVLPPPEYGEACARSYIAVRSPGTMAANVHVMTELRRLRPQFQPASLLDFGAGIGVSLTAAARVFRKLGSPDGSEIEGEMDNAENEHEKSANRDVAKLPTTLKKAFLVEKSREMRAVGAPIAAADTTLRNSNVAMRWAPLLSDADSDGYDVVVASYALCEIAKASITAQPQEGEDVSREARITRAEKQLRSVIRTLWARTRPGGALVIIEDGTSAGFETVLFARETIRRQGDAQVVAPCMHSLKCPLDGSIDRHRVCRFVQRLNRPLFLRVAKPKPNGFEDEYFSYIVLEKDSSLDASAEAENEIEGWGRLMRAPLLRGKHVVLDACLRDGTLERRTVSKRTAQPGMYNIARKAKWGDVWPLEPESRPQQVNF